MQNEVFIEECFEYLDNLRDSGVINMMGAVPYLAKEMNINDKELAKSIHRDWMENCE